MVYASRWRVLVLGAIGACSAKGAPAPVGPLPSERTVVAELPFERTVVAELPFAVSDLAWSGEGEERELFVAGRQNWARIGRNGDVAVTDLEPLEAGQHARSNARFVDVDGDGELELVCPAESWICPLEVFEPSGERSWTVPIVKGHAPDGTVWDDFDGDGRVEFAVWNDGLCIYSDTGELLRRLGVTRIVEAVPWELDGEGGILCTLGSTGAKWFAADGTRARAVELKSSLSWGSILSGGGFTNSVERIQLDGESGVLMGRHNNEQDWFLLAPDLSLVRTVDEEEVQRLRSTPVQLLGRSISVSHALWHEQLDPAGLGRSELKLYAYEAGNEIGSETLVDLDGHSEPALLADPQGGFLLGYGNRVLRYR